MKFIVGPVTTSEAVMSLEAVPRLERGRTLCAKRPHQGRLFSLNDAPAQAHVLAVENDRLSRRHRHCGVENSNLEVLFADAVDAASRVGWR